MKLFTATILFLLLGGCVVTPHPVVSDFDRDYIYALRNVYEPPNWSGTTYPGFTWGSYPWYGSNFGM